MKKITWARLIMGVAVGQLIVAGVLFAGAWSVAWWEAWAYIVITGLFSFLGRAVVMRRNPELLAERAQSLGNKLAKSWDKILMPLVAIVVPIVVLLIAAFDRRFAWTLPIHIGLKIGALFLLVLGTLISAIAFIENAFFSGTVRIQSDRNHTVISSGPYAVVRHPGYAGSLLGTMVTPFLLGSLWSLIPAVLLIVLMIIRTSFEDRTLQAELTGYREYVSKVPYRLIPWIW